MADRDALREGPQHFAITPGFDLLPIQLRDSVQKSFGLFLPDCFYKPFTRAIVRLESDATITHYPGFRVYLNGRELEQIPVQGELFPPLSPEGLPDFSQVRHYLADPTTLKPGMAEIRIDISMGGYNWSYGGNVHLTRLELVLYR